jgi:esterase/lipase superfamily enzyme
MSVTWRSIGVAAVLLLLTAMIVGCGAGAKPQAAMSKATTQSGSASESTSLREGTPTQPKAVEEKPTGRPKVKKMEAEASGATPEVDYDSKVVPRQDDANESGSAEEDAAANENLPYSVVKVYYATDRAPLDVPDSQRLLRGGWPVLTGVFAAVTIVLLVLWRHVGRAARALALVSLATTLVLGGLTLAYRWQPALERDEIEKIYGGGRGEFELGICKVSIPKDHRTGELESPTLLKLEFRPDPERHVVLLAVHATPADQFYADLRGCVGRSTRKEAFVFVHGYNVGFETAVRRTGQIAYDLKFEGAAIAYSWPSQEGLLGYTVDENNVDWTVRHLKEFLLDLAKRSGAESVHLVAHSMGNRALTTALRELEMEYKADCPKFREVVLTAPDVDADKFRRDLAPAIVKIADRVTLYASSNDKALIASRGIHGYLRAGESGNMMVVVPGIDTVDVSDVDTSLLGHSYYGSSTTVLADLYELMQASKPADQRKWLRSMWLDDLKLKKYWKFLKDKVHNLPSGENL